MFLTTNTVCTSGVRAIAVSTAALRGTRLPPRRASSAVTITVQPPSRVRSARLSGENPANTTLCTAPIRAQASIAQTASGVCGR